MPCRSATALIITPWPTLWHGLAGTAPLTTKEWARSERRNATREVSESIPVREVARAVTTASSRLQPRNPPPLAIDKDGPAPARGTLRIGTRQLKPVTVDWRRGALQDGSLPRFRLAQQLCEPDDWRNPRGRLCVS